LSRRRREDIDCPLVALVPQWRQNYPNKRPPSRATAISEMGQGTKSLRESPLRGGLSARSVTKFRPPDIADFEG
jgi:hypothetical protein